MFAPCPLCVINDEFAIVKVESYKTRIAGLSVPVLFLKVQLFIVIPDSNINIHPDAKAEFDTKDEL